MAKTGITNNNALQAAVVADLKNVVDYVVQKLWEENRDLVQKIVYDGYQPEEYERTNEFKEAWNTEVKTLNSFIQGEFKYDSRLLTVDTNNGQHSSLVDGTPMTEYLAEVIYDGLSGAIYEPGYAKNSSRFKGQPWANKRDVWSALLKWFNKTKLRQLFEEGMRKEGLDFIKHNVAINVTNT